MKSVRSFLIGVSFLALAACGPQASTAATVPVHTYGASAGNGSLGLHTVRRGETVWMISQRYNLALRDVLDANHLQPPYALTPGTRLTLPAPQTYRVRGGDNLYRVSQLFNTSSADLARLNRLPQPYHLKEGQTLRLPPRYDTKRETARPVVEPPIRAEPRRPAPAPIERESLSPMAMPQTLQPPQKNQQPASPVVPARLAEAVPRAGKFIKPVGGKIISAYGAKKDGLHNDGINIQAARGDAVRVAENGVVVYSGSQIEGYGNLILVRHADQYVTAYAHLDKILVKKGDQVKRGQTIGTVGSTGSVDKAQLHFEIRKGTKALNPAGLMAL